MFDQSRNTRKFVEIDIVKQTIDKANCANLLDIIHKYNLNIDIYNNKICCPFPFHKGGMERSASFYYYPNTNSFNCYGCKTGGGPVEFIEAYSNYDTTKYSAALSIINNYAISNSIIIDKINNNSTYMEFSHLIRNFIITRADNNKALDYAEYISAIFDDIKDRINLDPKGLDRLYMKLKNKLENFQ